MAPRLMDTPVRTAVASRRRRTSGLCAFLLLLLGVASPALVGADEPALEITELRLAGRDEDALALLQALRAQDPVLARDLGLAYAAGRLADLLGRVELAEESYARALEGPDTLLGHARFRLARRQAALGHPEVAAGLAATALAQRPPEALAAPLTELLVESIERGGDCRLLAGLEHRWLADRNRRSLEVAQARCDLAAGEAGTARQRLSELLGNRTDDSAALAAARLLDGAVDPAAAGALTAARVGTALHDQREFVRAIPWLEQAVEEAAGSRRGELRYLLARSYFWRSSYDEASRQFALAAQEAGHAEARSRALYQRARSLELAGEWPAAAQVFRQVASLQGAAGWAPAGLLSSLRLAWRQGREEQALADLERLQGRREWRSSVERAGIFLAASQISRGRLEGVDPWLSLAERADGDLALQHQYWSARLAEARGQTDLAVLRYAELLRRAAAHPLAVIARQRLAAPRLAATARREGLRRATSLDRRDLYVAWLLLGDDSAAGTASRQRVVQAFSGSAPLASLQSLLPLPPARWPLWEQPRSSPAELLLALGLWDEGAPAVAVHFPLEIPVLAVAGIDLLSRGGHYGDALRRSEMLARRLPSAMPVAFYPAPLIERLYPLPYEDILRGEAARQGVPPLLLAAIVREESRFRADAVSAVGARGLTQFVPETARRLAPRAGMRPPPPEDLHDPAVALALGAAYVAELLEHFGGQSLAALAAYNAGEDQTALWRSYCFSQEPDEFYSKVGFAETRGYLGKVVSSWYYYEGIRGNGRGVALRLP